MAIAPSDINFYLTNLTYDQSQTVIDLSIGGYESTTVVDFSTLFNSHLSPSLKQYRCVAVKNTNASSDAKSVVFFFKQPSQNANCSFRMAVERPAVDTYNGTTTTSLAGNLLAIQDSSISGTYADNAFAGCVLEILGGTNSGVKRKIISYDQSSHIIVVDASYAVAVENSISYIIHPSPSQRLLSGMDDLPNTFGSAPVTAFSAPTTPADAIGINVGGTRIHGADLKPNDVVYIWFERVLTRNADAYTNNTIVLATQFTP